MHRYSFTVFAALVLVLSVNALAQAPTGPMKDKKWEFTFFAGSSHRTDDTYPTSRTIGTNPPVVQTTDVGLNFASGYTVGGRITENLGRYFGAELEYSLANHPITFTNLLPKSEAQRATRIIRLPADHRVHQVTYTILVYGMPRSSRLRPFGLVGPGVSYYEVFGQTGQGTESGDVNGDGIIDVTDQTLAQSVNLRDRWQAGISLGGGVKYRVNNEFGVRFDVRNHLSGVPDFGLPHSGNDITPAFQPDGWIQNWQFTIGISYLFSDH